MLIGLGLPNDFADILRERQQCTLGCLWLLKDHTQWATIPMQNKGRRVGVEIHRQCGFSRRGGVASPGVKWGSPRHTGHSLDVAKELPPSFQLAVADPLGLAPWLLPVEEAGRSHVD